MGTPLKYAFIIFVNCIFVCLSVFSEAKVAPMSFGELVRNSDLIVEGQVLEQTEVKTEHEGFTLSRQSKVKISRVHKGEVKEGDMIAHYSGSDFICDVSSIQKGQQYLLFLKKYNDGYVDTHYGRGKYVITNEGNTVVPWTGADGREYYENFIDKIKLIQSENNIQDPPNSVFDEASWISEITVVKATPVGHGARDIQTSYQIVLINTFKGLYPLDEEVWIHYSPHTTKFASGIETGLKTKENYIVFLKMQEEAGSNERLILLRAESEIDRIITLPEHQSCKIDSECMVVGINYLGFCDCGMPVNKSHQDYYVKELEQYRQDHQTLMPDCSHQCHAVVCHNKKCQFQGALNLE